MSKLLLLLIVISSTFSNAQMQFKQVLHESGTIYSYEQLDRKLKPNEVPTIIAKDSVLKAQLSKIAGYPKFAKYKYMDQSVMVLTTIDEEGAISNLNVERASYPMFDTVAINLVKATSGLWQAGMVKGKSKSSVIHIPVFFKMNIDSNTNTLFFKVNIFPSNLLLTVDSSKSYPLTIYSIDSSKLMPDSGKFVFPKFSVMNRKFVKNLMNKNSLNPVVGTVRLGFNFSKERKISNVNVVHSVSTLLDERSINYLLNLEKSLVPAYEDGQYIDSYVEFDFLYDESSSKGKLYSRIAYDKANDLLANKNFKDALPLLEKANNYYLDDIELLFQLALVNFQLQNREAGCDYISKLMSVATDTSYPASTSEELVQSVHATYCNKE